MSPLASPRASEAEANSGPGWAYFTTDAHYRSVAERIATGFRAGASTILVTGEPIADARRLADALHETGVRPKAVTLSRRSNLEPNQYVTATEARGHGEVAAQNGTTPVVVVLDDVDRLSNEQLLEFQRWRRLGDRRIANAVLLSSPAFLARLETPELDGLKFGPGSRIPFQHLGMDEVEAFICDQLPLGKKELVTKEGVSAIANASGGDPGLVNRLADVMLQYKARARDKSEQGLPSVEPPKHSVPSESEAAQRNREHAPGPPLGEPRHPRESNSASSGGQDVRNARDGAAIGAERSEKDSPDWSNEHGVQDTGGGALIGAESKWSISTSGGATVADEAAPRNVSLSAFGSAQANKDLGEHGRAANHVPAETAPSEEVPGNFFANTAPRKVELALENTPCVPERVVSKLQLNSFGKPGAPESVKEAPHVDAEPVASPMPAERRWRRSSRALVLVTLLALLAAGMLGFDSVWRVYGSKVEQVVIASGGQVVTWLRQYREKAAPASRAGLSSPAQTAEPKPGAELPPAIDAAKQQDPGAEPAPNAPDRELAKATDTPEPLPAKGASRPNLEPSLSSATVPPEKTRPVSQAPMISASRQETPLLDVAVLVARGDEHFALRDIVSARQFYERAAAAGDARGALRMGMTFDPAFLGRAGLQRMKTDPEQALSWYRRASTLGSTEAEQLLDTLTPKQ